jgi:hypothetical protein
MCIIPIWTNSVTFFWSLTVCRTPPYNLGSIHWRPQEFVASSFRVLSTQDEFFSCKFNIYHLYASYILILSFAFSNHMSLPKIIYCLLRCASCCSFVGGCVVLRISAAVRVGWTRIIYTWEHASVSDISVAIYSWILELSSIEVCVGALHTRNVRVSSFSVPPLWGYKRLWIIAFLSSAGQSEHGAAQKQRMWHANNFTGFILRIVDETWLGVADRLSIDSGNEKAAGRRQVVYW